MAVEVTVDPEVAQKVDRNGDGHISKEEMEMNLEFKRKELESPKGNTFFQKLVSSEEKKGSRPPRRKMAGF